MGGSEIVAELHQLMARQCSNMIRQHEVIRHQLESALQRAQYAKTPLQEELNSDMLKEQK